MSELTKKKRPDSFVSNAGQPPGTMVFLGQQKQEEVSIDFLHYSASLLQEEREVSVDQCWDIIKEPGVTWISVSGIHDVEIIGAIGKRFGLHPLTLEDLVNPFQRPRTEEFPNYISFALKMLAFDEATSQVEIEHVSLILGENYVISFLEDAGDVFDGVRDRIRAANGKIRTLNSDYLVYSLIDTVVDQYFLAIEQIGDLIEDIDLRILSNPNPDDIQLVHHFKRDILRLRKSVWPLREEIAILERTESPLIRPGTKVFLRDLYNHTIEVIDMVETFRDILGGIHDTYLSSVSNRMNEVMKVLTIIATIFIPLTFIVGVYGMNFEYMPELEWRFGYYMIWGVMLAVSAGLVWFFKRKDWM